MFLPCAYLTVSSQGQRKSEHTLTKLEIKLEKFVKNGQQRRCCFSPSPYFAFRFLLFVLFSIH